MKNELPASRSSVTTKLTRSARQMTHRLATARSPASQRVAHFMAEQVAYDAGPIARQRYQSCANVLRPRLQLAARQSWAELIVGLASKIADSTRASC